MPRTTAASRKAAAGVPKEEEIPKELRSFNRKGRGEMATDDDIEVAADVHQPPGGGNGQPPQPPQGGVPPPGRAQAQPPDPQEGDSSEDENDNRTGDEVMAQHLQDTRDDLDRMRRELNLLRNKEVSTRTINETKVPAFSGLKDNRKPELWLAKLDSIAAQNNWDDNRYIEAGANAFTGEAENWMQSERFSNDTGMSRSLRDRESFKRAFLEMFNAKCSQVEQMFYWTQLSQDKDESVRSFWIRVESGNTEFIQNFFRKKYPVVNDRNRKNVDREKRIIVEYTNQALRDMFFINGLKKSIQDLVKPRMKDIMTLKISMLDAAQEAEAAVHKPAHQTVAAVSNKPTWAKKAAPNKGGGQQGGANKPQQPQQQQYQPQRQQQQSQNDGSKRLRKIQNRQKPIFCYRCKQWGKHFKNECPVPISVLQTMQGMDINDVPEVAQDMAYDSLTEMPVLELN